MFIRLSQRFSLKKRQPNDEFVKLESFNPIYSGDLSQKEKMFTRSSTRFGQNVVVPRGDNIKTSLTQHIKPKPSVRNLEIERSAESLDEVRSVVVEKKRLTEILGTHIYNPFAYESDSDGASSIYRPFNFDDESDTESRGSVEEDLSEVATKVQPKDFVATSDEDISVYNPFADAEESEAGSVMNAEEKALEKMAFFSLPRMEEDELEFEADLFLDQLEENKDAVRLMGYASLPECQRSVQEDELSGLALRTRKRRILIRLPAKVYKFLLKLVTGKLFRRSRNVRIMTRSESLDSEIL